jgi:CBS domain-containing protein
MPRHVSLKHYMLNKPITIQSDATIFEAAHQILRHKVSGVCVVDKKNNLLGMLSEMDCLRAIVNRMYIGGEDHAGTVAEVMTTEVMCNAPGDDIVSVANSMLTERHRRRPVVEEGKLVGQVTCRQILKAIKDFAAPADPSEYTQ